MQLKTSTGLTRLQFDSIVKRLKTVKSLSLDAGLDFHGLLHKSMAKQLAKALDPNRPLFIEEPLLAELPKR